MAAIQGEMREGDDLRPLLVPYKGAQRTLGNVSRGTVQKLVRDGDLPAVKVRGRTMFRLTDLEAYIAEGSV